MSATFPIAIMSRGQGIYETDYWDSDLAQAGYAYLSWNAGAARLLLPSAMLPAPASMRAASSVILSRGPWPEGSSREGVELIFLDGTQVCYSLLLDAPLQMDRDVPPDEQSRGFVVTAWRPLEEVLRLPARYRRVPGLPCLRPWRDDDAVPRPGRRLPPRYVRRPF